MKPGEPIGAERQRLIAAMELGRMAQAELARRHLLDYIIYSDPDYIVGDHHRLIADQLDATLAEVMAIKQRKVPKDYTPTENRIIITVPPRHGKSRMCSEEFPSYGLGKYPDLSFIVTSYSAQLSFDFSRRARNRLAETGNELFNVKVSRDTGAVERWAIAGHPFGGFVAAGVGGPITGRGAHIAILDDPFKNWQEAASPTVRNSVWEWYKSTFRTRLAPGGAIIIIMTRWHEDDIVGRLLAADRDGNGEKWKVINFPAVCEDKTDVLGRKLGDALWPDMFPLPELQAVKTSLGGYLWNALYQQRPRPAEGALFKRQHFRYFEVDEGVLTLHRGDGIVERFHRSSCWCFQTCDPSGSAKQSADYFALATWLVTPKSDLLLMDMTRLRAEAADQLGILKGAHQRWGPQLQGVETKSMGITLFQLARNSGLPVIELPTEGDKVIRARPMVARYEAAKVFHPKTAPWLDDFEEELVAFPKAAHDDQVDVTSYAAIVLGMAYQATLGSVLAVYDEPLSISPF